MRIYVVEDNLQVGEFLRQGLILSGNEVKLYTDAQVCIKEVLNAWFNRSTLPDVLVTDLDLGQGIDGVEMIKRLRKFIPPLDLPVVIISGRDVVELNRLSNYLFDIRVLQKPVTATTLLKEIKQDVFRKE